MKNPFINFKNKLSPKHATLEDHSFRHYEGGEWTVDEEQQPLKQFINSARIKKIFFLIFLGLLVLLGRLFILQIAKGGYYYKVAEGNRIRIEEIKANRGLIYDRNEKLLVENVPIFYLTIVPADLPSDDNELSQMLDRVSEIIGSPIKEKVKEALKNLTSYSYQPVIIEEYIEPGKAILLKIEEDNFPGLNMQMRTGRRYPADLGLSHSIGYVGKINQEEWASKKESSYALDDYIGKTGLEFYYENDLKGEKGRKRIEVDSVGKEKEVLDTENSQAGKGLVLSLDVELQKKLAESFKNQIEKLKLKKGVAIAMDPRNGEILAMTSLPDFDNNLFVSGISQEEYQSLSDNPDKPFVFRAVSGEYPPGSIIKPLIALAALEEGIITARTTINSAGGIRIDKWFYPDWKAGGHGLTDIRKALAESVNTFFYFVGGGYEDFEGLGVKKITSYLREFGLNSKTGIDLPGEKGGFLPSPDWKEEVKGERWYVGDTYHLAIGQGDILVTPLQVANFTAMIANGGTLYKSHLVKETVDLEKGERQEVEEEVINSNIVDKDYIKTVQQGLRDTVVYGSARALSGLSVKVAGKTGTAQVGGDENPHAWFTCYAPYDDPEIVITILIENGGEGSATALPVARDVLTWYFSREE